MVFRGIRKQLLVPIIAIITVLMSLSLILSTVSRLNEAKKSIEQYRSEKYDDYKAKLTQLVDNAYSVMVYYNKLEQENKMTRDAAMSAAKDSIRALRYGKDGYYWIDNDKYICQVLPPDPKKEGTSREGLEDLNKVKIVKTFVDESLKNEEAYLQYYFRRLNDDTPYPKLGYTKLFKEWNWIVGTGFYIDELDKVVAEKEKAVKIEIRKKIAIDVATIILILGILSFAVYKITKPVIKGIEDIKDVLYEGSHGNLNVKVEKIYNNEIGEIATSFNEFTEKLNTIVKDIKDGAITIKGSTQELNKANETLASKALTQASALEETSATMEEISSIIISNSEKTIEASKLTSGTKEKTEIVGEMSVNLKGAIEDISDSSKKIENIINVIDEIAFQTNLLALNAAVEAARAGEQGRGFAVVAVEVRNLAARSSKAAKEIKELIKESVGRVEQGTMLVENTIKNVEEIVTDVKKINDVISVIAVSAEEQKSGVEDINKAIADLDAVTQTNAGIAEETSATTTGLYNRAIDFLEIVNFFKTDEDDYKDSNRKGIRELD